MSHRTSALKRSAGEGKPIATITDTLTTILQLTGTQQMIAGLGSASTAVQGMAVAQGQAAAASTTLGASLAALAANPLTLVIAGVGALVGILGRSASAWGEADLRVTRIAATMRNLGNVFPTQDLLAFAGALSRTTGIDDELIATLGATAAQFGLTRQQIEKLLPVVLDISQIKGIDPGQVLQTLLRASRGRPQGLVALGIDPSKIKGDLKDVDNLISQVGQGFAGGAAAVRNTLPGALEALKTSTENLFEAIGRLFGPSLIKIIDVVIFVVDKLTDAINKVAELAERFHIIRQRNSGGVGDGSIALKGDPEHTRLLGRIADNTGKQADRLAQEVLGGAGTVAGGAVSWRDFGMAFGV